METLPSKRHLDSLWQRDIDITKSTDLILYRAKGTCPKVTFYLFVKGKFWKLPSLSNNRRVSVDPTSGSQRYGSVLTSLSSPESSAAL